MQVLPIGFIGSVILDFAKKRTKNEKHLMRNFILCNILFFLIFGLVVGGGMVFYGNVMQTWNPGAPQRFLVLVACLFPLIGMIHGLIWWLVFKRKNK